MISKIYSFFKSLTLQKIANALREMSGHVKVEKPAYDGNDIKNIPFIKPYQPEPWRPYVIPPNPKPSEICDEHGFLIRK